MINMKGLTHFTIPVSDLKRANDFYVDTLGFKFDREHPHRGSLSRPAAFSVLQGQFAFISGAIANVGPDAMTIRTPVGTLGIRGTPLLILLAQSGQVLAGTRV